MDLRSLSGKQWKLRSSMCSDGMTVMQALCMERKIDDTHINPALCVPPAAQGALALLEEAIQSGRKIGIFGDYDCDGITASLLMLRFLRRRGVDPLVRLPHRARDGYGLQVPAVQSLKESGVDLLVTIDNGIVARDAVTEARTLGMDVLIIDHHRVPSVRPDATITLHPDDVPALQDAQPCAAGLMYLLLSAWEGTSWPGQEEDKALAAIGTVADLVPLRGCNRWLVREGLRALRHLPACPLRELVESIRDTSAITCQDIGFRIAPRINAAGRMADPMLALHALIHGGDMLLALNALNRERQDVTETLLQAVMEDLRTGRREEDACLCVASEQFLPGIVGLLAGKLTERFGKPALVGSIQGGICTASLRSPACYDITMGLGRIASLLDGFGGHAQAAGCTFDHARFHLVREALCGDVAATVTQDALRPTLLLDGTLKERDITAALLDDLETLEPYGQGNPEPVFLMEEVRMRDARIVGRDGAHLQARIGDCRCVAFRQGHLLPLLSTDLAVDIAFRVTRDDWRGGDVVQMEIADMRLAVAKSALATV